MEVQNLLLVVQDFRVGKPLDEIHCDHLGGGSRLVGGGVCRVLL